MRFSWAGFQKHKELYSRIIALQKSLSPSPRVLSSEVLRKGPVWRTKGRYYITDNVSKKETLHGKWACLVKGFFFKLHLFYSFMYLSVCLHVCIYTTCILAAYRAQQSASDPLWLEFQIFVSCHVWGLGSEPRSSARTPSALNHWTITRVLLGAFKIISFSPMFIL